MNLNKKDFDPILKLWIQSDPVLWVELRTVEIDILIDRVVNEFTFKTLAGKFNSTEKYMRKALQSILTKIEKYVDASVGRYLTELNQKIDKVQNKPFDVFEINLN